MSVDDRSSAYCERRSDAFDLSAEPLNVTTDVVLILTGVAYTYLASQKPTSSIYVPGGVLFTLVGMGSMVWHLTGYTWAYYFEMVFPVMFIGCASLELHEPLSPPRLSSRSPRLGLPVSPPRPPLSHAR